MLAEGFHPADIARIKNNDDWLKRFLEHSEFNDQEAFNMLWDTCTWRRKIGANGKIMLFSTCFLTFAIFYRHLMIKNSEDSS